MKKPATTPEVPTNEPRLYRVVAARIQDLIRDENIKAGERLPAERELAAKLSVSRASLREALITGLDLVQWQLLVASGAPLPLTQDQLTINGHALEARVYAENPERGFLPSTGTLTHLATPQAVEFQLGGSNGQPAAVRIDSGVRAGDAISPFYDPMIAKLIVWGADREQALARMAQALGEFQVLGLSTNLAFLKRLVEGSAFANAELDTGLIERHHDALFPPPQPVPPQVLALAVAALASGEAQAARPADPWSQAGGWRLNGNWTRTLAFSDPNGTRYELALRYHAQGWQLQAGPIDATLALVERDSDRLSIALDGAVIRATVRREQDTFHVFTSGRAHALTYVDPLAHAGEAEHAGGTLSAPMPGKVVAVLAAKGQQVKKGDPLVIMEAMKMEHTITAPSDGLVEEVLYQTGDQVADGAPLLAFAAA